MLGMRCTVMSSPQPNPQWRMRASRILCQKRSDRLADTAKREGERERFFFSVNGSALSRSLSIVVALSSGLSLSRLDLNIDRGEVVGERSMSDEDGENVGVGQNKKNNLLVSPGPGATQGI